MNRNFSEDKKARLSDSELMAEVRKGNVSAFGEIVRRYEGKILNFFRRLGVVNDVEDLAQETFFKIYRYRKRYRPVAPFEVFLFRIASQVHVDYLRKKSRSVSTSELTAEVGVCEDSKFEQREEVQRALSKLTVALRAVVILRIFMDLSYEEIADILSIPVGTAKSRMFHALRILKKHFELEKLKKSEKT